MSNRARARRRSTGTDVRRLLGVVAVFVLVPAIGVSAAFASPALAKAGSPLERQIAALKKQVRALTGQRNELRQEVRFLKGRVTSLQQDAEQQTALIPQLAEISAATGRYRELANALADGYVQHSGCIPTAGTHYMRGGWPSDDVLNPLEPEFLMYASIGGSLKLVAVEYAVPARFPQPKFLGGTFEIYAGGPGEPIWFLHVWLWHPNPAGTFAAVNRTVTC
jgi:cell division protein FtsB